MRKCKWKRRRSTSQELLSLCVFLVSPSSNRTNLNYKSLESPKGGFEDCVQEFSKHGGFFNHSSECSTTSTHQRIKRTRRNRCLTWFHFHLHWLWAPTSTLDHHRLCDHSHWPKILAIWHCRGWGFPEVKRSPWNGPLVSNWRTRNAFMSNYKHSDRIEMPRDKEVKLRSMWLFALF